MALGFLRVLLLFALVPLATVATAVAQDCTGTITADEAMKAELARYAAQTSNDFAAMEKLFGADLVYNHSSAAMDDKAKYMDAMRSGRTKYRKMTPNVGSPDPDVRLPGHHHRHRGLRGHLGRPGSDGAAALHRHLGQAARRDRVRLLAVNGDSRDPVGAAPAGTT